MAHPGQQQWQLFHLLLATNTPHCIQHEWGGSFSSITGYQHPTSHPMWVGGSFLSITGYQHPPSCWTLVGGFIFIYYWLSLIPDVTGQEMLAVWAEFEVRGKKLNKSLTRGRRSEVSERCWRTLWVDWIRRLLAQCFWCILQRRCTKKGYVALTLTLPELIVFLRCHMDLLWQLPLKVKCWPSSTFQAFYHCSKVFNISK